MDMNTNYKRISLSDKVFIEENLDKKNCARQIAAHLGRSKSSICDELKTNKTFAIEVQKCQQAKFTSRKIEETNICPKLKKMTLCLQ